MCTIAGAKVQLNYNCYNVYLNECLRLFDACAAGRVLILSPWPYDANKHHISRMECVVLNEMAEEICHVLSKKNIAQENS
jgi:hypothetical protein